MYVVQDIYHFYLFPNDSPDKLIERMQPGR